MLYLSLSTQNLFLKYFYVTSSQSPFVNMLDLDPIGITEDFPRVPADLAVGCFQGYARLLTCCLLDYFLAMILYYRLNCGVHSLGPFLWSLDTLRISDSTSKGSIILDNFLLSSLCSYICSFLGHVIIYIHLLLLPAVCSSPLSTYPSHPHSLSCFFPQPFNQ